MERELLFPPQNPVAEHQLLAIKTAQIKCAGKKHLNEEKIKRENFLVLTPSSRNGMEVAFYKLDVITRGT